MSENRPHPAVPLPAAETVLSGIVVHWRNESELAALVDAWPEDPRFELVVVDNSGTATALPPRIRHAIPKRNLGFGGGIARGLEVATAPLVLILNPDARPRPGALDALVAAFDQHPDAAGIVPALEDADGRSQCRWQLRPLPTPAALVLQTLRFVAVHGPLHEPAAGAAIQQPAAAALAFRRSALDAVGGFDTGFYPAWFEDVDLARRLADAGAVLRFAPAARFVHDGGASVPRLGYGPFLWIYYRHLDRYLRRHHGLAWALAGRATLTVSMLLRTLLVPLRRPRQAASRKAAIIGLLVTALGALSGWRLPASFRVTFRPPELS